MVTTRVKKEKANATTTTTTTTKTEKKEKKEKGSAKPMKTPKTASKTPAKKAQKPAKKSYGGAGKDLRSKKQKEKQAKLLSDLSLSQNLGKCPKSSTSRLIDMSSRCFSLSLLSSHPPLSSPPTNRQVMQRPT